MKRSNYLMGVFFFIYLSLPLYANDFETIEKITDTQDLNHRLIEITVNADQSVTRKYGDVTIFSNIPSDVLLRNEKRSIRILNKDQIDSYKITVDKINKVLKQNAKSLDEFYIFANFINGYNGTETIGDYVKKDAQFWVAIIRKDVEVRDILFQEEQFYKGIGSHFQLRFIIDDKVLLIPQDQTSDESWDNKVVDLSGLDVTDKKILEMRSPFLMRGDLVYSLNAVRTENGPKSWGMVDGGLGSFANSLGIYSTAHVSYNQTETNVVKQYEIKFDKQKGKNIFAFAINRSSQIAEKGIYHTIHNACHTSALEALYADSKGISFNPYEEFNPYRIISGLKEKGIVVSEQDTINKIFKAKVQSLNDVKAYQLAQKYMFVLNSNIFDKLILDIGNFILKEKVNKEELAALKKILSDPNNIPQNNEQLIQFSLANNVKPERMGYFLQVMEKEKMIIQGLIKNRFGVDMDVDKVWTALVMILAKV